MSVAARLLRTTTTTTTAKRNWTSKAHSRRTEASLSAALSVVTIPTLRDNYSYLVYDRATRVGAVVDCGDAKPVLDTLKDLNVTLDRVLCTHHHSDHVAGLAALRDAFPSVPILATDERVAMATDLLPDRHEAALSANVRIRTLLVPCHTRRHAAFFVSSNDAVDDGGGAESHSAVFVGDTLFVAGCGRFFEGHAADLYTAMFDTLFTLPQRTLMYCGHEYTEANLRFALSLEPDNGRVTEMAARVAARRDQGLPTVPQLLHDELLYNPFARCRERAIAKRLGFMEWSATDRNTHIAVLDQLRTMRNNAT
jgi:hydroxyacylglutathione hydrolase